MGCEWLGPWIRTQELISPLLQVPWKLLNTVQHVKLCWSWSRADRPLLGGGLLGPASGEFGQPGRGLRARLYQPGLGATCSHGLPWTFPDSFCCCWANVTVVTMSLVLRYLSPRWIATQTKRNPKVSQCKKTTSDFLLNGSIFRLAVLFRLRLPSFGGLLERQQDRTFMTDWGIGEDPTLRPKGRSSVVIQSSLKVYQRECHKAPGPRESFFLTSHTIVERKVLPSWWWLLPC